MPKRFNNTGQNMSQRKNDSVPPIYLLLEHTFMTHPNPTIYYSLFLSIFLSLLKSIKTWEKCGVKPQCLYRDSLTLIIFVFV